MPNVNDLKQSKFLKKEDVVPDKVVTIKAYKTVDVSLQSQPPDEKYALYFNELEKPLVLNQTNGKRIAKIVGSDEFDDWIGKVVVLYNDEMIEFQGEIVGGIRVKAVRQQEESPPQQQEDDIPF
jgi:hypothetical protein